MINMIYDFAFRIHGGGFGFSSILASLLEFLESLAGKTPPEMFFAVMPGIANMENIHPLFVHYPIAFFTAFLVLDIAGVIAKKPQWRYVASWLLYAGTVAAVFTVIAGLFAAETVEHGEDVHGIMERHEHIGKGILALSLILSAVRIKGWGISMSGGNWLFLLFSGLLVLLVALGADLGGLMVYQYGVSVKQNAEITEPEQSGAMPLPLNSSVNRDKHSQPQQDHVGHSHSHGDSHKHHHHSH